MKVAFCGLGQMGAPMAARLVEGGHEVVVWNRTADRAKPLLDCGARLAPTPAEAARESEVAITMLSAPAAVEGVVLGEGGVATGLGPGRPLIEMSTIGPDAVRAIGSRLPAGVEMFDAPVLGSVPQATEGSLKIFFGGPDEAFRRWEPILRAFGTPRHLGPFGSGAAMKLVVNSTLGALMAVLGEAVGLGDALGLDEKAVLDVLSESPIGVTARSKRAFIESGRYPPNFKLSLALKDVQLVLDAAARAGREVKVAPGTRAWFEEASKRGMGALDYSAVVAAIRGRPASG